MVENPLTNFGKNIKQNIFIMQIQSVHETRYVTPRHCGYEWVEQWLYRVYVEIRISDRGQKEDLKCKKYKI